MVFDLIRLQRPIFFWFVFGFLNVPFYTNLCGKPQKARIWLEGQEGIFTAEKGFATKRFFCREGRKAPGDFFCHEGRKTQSFFHHGGHEEDTEFTEKSDFFFLNSLCP